MNRDGYEYPCSTIDISPAGVAIRGFAKGFIGERVVLYLDEIGRIEGVVARFFGECFAIRVNAPEKKRERLAKKIQQLAEHPRDGALESDRDGSELRDEPQPAPRVPERSDRFGRLINVSYSGEQAAGETAPRASSLLTIRYV